MFPLCRVMALLFIAVCLVGGSLADSIVTENLGRVANPANGCLSCDAASLTYSIPDSDVFALAFNDTSTIGNTTVEYVRLGRDDGQVECAAARYPKFSVPSGFTIVTGYDKCGFVRIPDSVAQKVVYSGEAFISVLRPSPGSGVVIRKRFSTKLNCEASLKGVVGTNVQYYELTVPLPDKNSSIDVSFTALSKQEVRPFGNEQQALVYVLQIELDSAFRLNYTILGNECWASGPPDPVAVVPTYHFISSQSCNKWGSDYVAHSREGTHKLIYEIAGFEFSEPTPVLHFYCDVNVCLKTGDQSRCEEVCDSIRIDTKSPTDRTSGSDYRLGTAAITPRTDAVGRIVVNYNGVPHLPRAPAEVSPIPETTTTSAGLTTMIDISGFVFIAMLALSLFSMNGPIYYQ